MQTLKKEFVNVNSRDSPGQEKNSHSHEIMEVWHKKDSLFGGLPDSHK